MNDATASCVLLADRHHSLSEGVRGLLETVFSTVFMVADEASLVEGARRLRRTVIVADLSLAPGDALGFVRRLRASAGNAKMLLLSGHDEMTVAQSAIAAGADGVVLKRSIAADLLPGIESLLSGSRYVSLAIHCALGCAADKQRRPRRFLREHGGSVFRRLLQRDILTPSGACDARWDCGRVAQAPICRAVGAAAHIARDSTVRYLALMT